MGISRAIRRDIGLGLLCAATFMALACSAQAATFTGGAVSMPDVPALPDCVPGLATPYPSQISVAGLGGTITDVNVTVTNFTHSFPGDVRMLLVGPGGQTTLIFNEVDTDSASDVTLTFDDQAATPIPDPIVSGSYQPTQDFTCSDSVQSSMGLPAPPAPYGLTLGAFDTTSPNGVWRLYVTDNEGGDVGDIESWSLAITTTTGGPTTFSNPSPITIDDPPDDEPDCDGSQATAVPYGAPIAVSGLTTAVTDVNVTLANFTHTYPRDLRMLLVGPTGATTLIMHHASGGSDVSDVTFTLDDDAPGPVPDPIVPGSYQPTQGDDPDEDCPLVLASTSLPAPAPAAPYGATLDAFDGTNANGTWKLYVVDDYPNDSGDFEAWSLDITTAASYSSEVLGENPGGYWRFGEPSGTALLDSSPNANNGTYLGGVTLGAAGAIVGDANTAASYDGVNDTGRVPDANSLDVGSSFTMEGWIKRSSTAKTQELFNKGANGLQLSVMNAGSGNKVFLRKAGVTTIAQSTSGVPADGAYHYVAATMNGTGATAHIYVDGADVTQVLAAGAAQSIANTAFPLTFGIAGSAQAFYDEFALYDEALPSCEIGDHYTTATGGQYIGC